MTDTEIVTPESPTEEPTPKPEGATFTPEQEAEINRRMAATRRQAEADAKRKLEEQQAQKEQQTKEQREREEAEKRGEFEKVVGDLDGKLKATTEERDALLAKVQAREDQDKAEVAAWIKDHKGIVDEFLDYYPGADAPADAQMAWYAATRPKVEKRVTDPVRGNGRSPESANGRDTQADEAARLAQSRVMTRSF